MALVLSPPSAGALAIWREARIPPGDIGVSGAHYEEARHSLKGLIRLSPC
jgi:hypothetical protein